MILVRIRPGGERGSGYNGLMAEQNDLQERRRWVSAWIATALLATGFVLLFSPTLRWISALLLGAYLVIVEIALRYAILRDYFVSRYGRPDDGRQPVPYEERVRIRPTPEE